MKTPRYISKRAGLASKRETVKPSPSKGYAVRGGVVLQAHPRPPQISCKCGVEKHSSCTKLNCTCACHLIRGEVV